MLKLGEKIISDIYLGDKKIAKVFLGDKLVYQAGKPIFLDYIITDGNSYIDTEYCPNKNTVIEYTYEITASPGGWSGLVGSRKNTGVYPYNIMVNSNGRLRLDYGKYSDSYEVGYNLNTKYTLRAGTNEIYINGELCKSYEPLLNDASVYSMYLGNFNNAGTPYTNGAPQKIYGFKVYENNILLQDLRPCVVNGVAGFYDMVTGKIFTNAGTGTLKASGRFVESIVFDGASWIDTGIKQQTCRMVTGRRFIAGTSKRMLEGWNGNSGCYWGVTKNLYLEYNGITVSKADFTQYSVIEFSMDSTTQTTTLAYGKEFKTGSYVANSYTYYIGSIDASTSYALIGEVYFHTVYDAEGVIIQDLRPYVDENGVACFKDLVTGKLFYNQGTGKLEYTE